MERLDYDIDNRDVRTTWLCIKDHDDKVIGYVEVDLVDLIQNSLENNEEIEDTSDVQGLVDLLNDYLNNH